MTQHVSNQSGCRIHYGNSGLQHIATVAHELPSHVFGPQDLHQVSVVITYMSMCHSFSESSGRSM